MHPPSLSPAPFEAGPAALKLVFVCTANLCRSPIAELLAAREGRERGFPVLASSMGLMPGGRPSPALGVRVAAEFGLDLSGHRSRQLGLAELQSADLILTMTREHAREVVHLDPGLWPRVFTLKQHTEYLRRHPPNGSTVQDWMATVGPVRRRSELVGRHPRHDVIDPMGRSAGVWREVVIDLSDHLSLLFDALVAARAGANANAQLATGA